MQTTTSQRLTIARKHLGLTLREFAEPLGVSHGTVGHWEVDSSLSKMATIAIEQVYKISSEWLLTGNGEMIIEKPCDHTNQSSNAQKLIDIPLLSLRLISGQDFDRQPTVLSTLTFDEEWLQRRGIATSHLFLAEIDGDTMTPTLNPGDIVIVDRSAGFSDGLWVFKIENAVHLKRLQQLGSGHFQATCDNSTYNTIELNKIPHLIGKVVWSDKRW